MVTTKQLIDSITEAIRKGAEEYEDALDEACDCGTREYCKRCSLIEKARSRIESVIGHYEQH